MTREEAEMEAYQILLARMPPTWIEASHPDGRTQMTPRAVKLKNAIADAILDAYSAGVEYALENHS